MVDLVSRKIFGTNNRPGVNGSTATRQKLEAPTSAVISPNCLDYGTQKKIPTPYLCRQHNHHKNLSPSHTWNLLRQLLYLPNKSSIFLQTTQSSLSPLSSLQEDFPYIICLDFLGKPWSLEFGSHSLELSASFASGFFFSFLETELWVGGRNLRDLEDWIIEDEDSVWCVREGAGDSDLLRRRGGSVRQMRRWSTRSE